MVLIVFPDGTPNLNLSLELWSILLKIPTLSFLVKTTTYLEAI
jgi:hypothetical protein